MTDHATGPLSLLCDLRRRWRDLVWRHKPKCWRESRYGDCHRQRGHQGIHATGIGPGYWFAWERDNATHVGYGTFRLGRFEVARHG